jgi:hypothetical protein
MVFEFLKPQFDEHESCQTIGFIIYNFHPRCHVCEESISINDINWDEMLDPDYERIHDNITGAIE